MDKQITQLIELDQFVGDEYVVLASEEYADNYKVKARDLVGEFVNEFIIVDDHLSETSINPVLNRVITAELKKIDERLDNLDGGNNGEGGNNNPGTGGGSGSGSSNYNFNLAVASVETETLEPGKSANVRITDLGVDNTNTKNLAFKFSIPRGADGKGGSGDADDGGESFGYRTVFAFKSSKTKPAKPVGGHWDVTTNTVTYPAGWSPGDNLERPVWMSNATFDYKGIVQDWTDPFEVSGSDSDNDGPNDGSDSKVKEFIYKQTIDEEKPDYPYNDVTVSDYVPLGWDDHPNGVGYIDVMNSDGTPGKKLILCEWVCTRDYDDAISAWGAWEGPVLWSKYGVNGKDGDGVEYIYQLTYNYTRPATPGITPASHSPVVDFQEREFIPEKAATDENIWTDDPSDVTAITPYIWVSVRKFNWSEQKWGFFQEPTLWGKYGKDGGEGIAIFKSLVFCRTNSIPAAPVADEDGGSYSNPVPLSSVKDSYGNPILQDGRAFYWTDGIPTGTEQIWMTSRIFSADGKLPQLNKWTDPQPLSDTSDFEVIYSPSEIRPDIPEGFKKIGVDIDPTWLRIANDANWYDDANDWGTNPTVWMATNQAKNGVWQGWNVMKVLGEKGEKGTGINVLGSFDSYEQLENADLNPSIGDAYLINGEIFIWDGNSWVNGGNIQGSPGKGVVSTNYRYAVSKYNNQSDVLNDLSTLWFSYSPATTEAKKYLWKETSIVYGYVDKNDNDEVTYYEIIGTHGDRGIDGESIEYIYILTKENRTPNAPIGSESITTNIKGNWTDDPQDVSATYPYQWVSERTRKYDSDSDQMKWGSYSTPTKWTTHVKGITSIETRYATSNSSTEHPESGWQINSPATTSDKPFLWKRTKTLFTDNSSTDYVYEMIGSKGDPGIDGESTEFAFRLTTEKVDPKDLPLPSGKITSNVPGDWTDDAQMLGNYDAKGNWIGTSTENLAIVYKYQYVSKRVKPEGIDTTFGEWSIPSLWSELYPGMFFHIKYSNDLKQFTSNNGEDVGKYIGVRVDYQEGDSGEFNDYTWNKFLGDDGFGREYIFKLGTDYNNPPTVSTLANEQRELYIPSGWSANPITPTSTNKYCWCCHRDYRDNVWGNWTGNSTNITKAYLFSMYAESVKGETGKQGPILYPAGYWVSNGGYVYKETAVPYVFDNEAESYYVLMAEDKNPSTRPSNNIAWLKMETFNAIYADIGVFGNALVGKAVFNGNYMFSQNGNGQYKDFDGSKIYKEGSPFDPAWCINLVTGEQWSGTGAVYFAADGSGYLSQGKINWDAAGNLTLPPNGNISIQKYEHTFGHYYGNVSFAVMNSVLNSTSNVTVIGYQTETATSGDELFNQNVLLPYGNTISVGVNAKYYKKYELKVNDEIVATTLSTIEDDDVKDFNYINNTTAFSIELKNVTADRVNIHGNYIEYIGDSCTIEIVIKNISTTSAKFRFSVMDNIEDAIYETVTISSGEYREYRFTNTHGGGTIQIDKA